MLSHTCHPLEAFEEICVALKASDVSDDDMKLRAFSFSLKDKAKDWYYSLAADRKSVV